MDTTKTYAITDHACRYCNGRVLRVLTGAGMTPGGNPMWECADCGKKKAGFDASVICWCGATWRNGVDMGMRCWRTDDPRSEVIQALRLCGVATESSVIGIVKEEALVDALHKSEKREEDNNK